MKYILLIDDKYYRVKIRVNKSILNKCFYFVKYGGKKKALDAAIKWRNVLLKKFGLEDRLNYKKSPDYFRQNKTNAIIGVYKTCTDGRYSWTAHVCNGTKRHFSIKVYGNKEAFIMACKVRYQYHGTLRVINKKLMPCKPTVPYKLTY